MPLWKMTLVMYNICIHNNYDNIWLQLININSRVVTIHHKESNQASTKYYQSILTSNARIMNWCDIILMAVT